MATRAEIEQIQKAQVEAILRAQGQFISGLASREPRLSKPELLASPFAGTPAKGAFMAQNSEKEAPPNAAVRQATASNPDIHEPGLAISGLALLAAMVLVSRMIRRIWD